MEPTTSQMCGVCGAALPSDVRFCTKCGALVSTAPPPIPPRIRSSNNGPAITSLVFGLLGGSVLALAFGYVARGQIGRSGGRERGLGLAITGIVLGWLELAATVAIVVAVVVAAGDGSPHVGSRQPSPSGHNVIVTPRTTVPSTPPPTASPTVAHSGVRADVVAIADELAAALSAHDWDAVRMLEPSKGDWSDEKFDSLDADLRQDTFIPSRSEDLGNGWTRIEGGLIAQETTKTRFFCAKWEVNVALHQIDETGPTTLVRDIPGTVSAQSLEAEARATC